MKTHRTHTFLVMLLGAVLAAWPLVSGCGGGGGGATSATGDAAAPIAEDPGTATTTDGDIRHGFLPDGTPIVEDTSEALIQPMRIVGDAGCSATRAFSKARILPGAAATVTVTISGCAGNLESLYYATVIPTDLALTTISVKVNGIATPYVYEAPTATSTYHHWVLDDVPVDGGVELPAGQAFQLMYRVQDDGLHPDEYVYDFTGFLWSAHDTGTSGNVWGYSDGGFNLTVGLPPLGGSGGPNMNTYYAPEKAFDGNYRSWWAGLQNYGRWDLYYRFPAMQHMDDLFINFYSTSHVSSTVNIYWSNDGINWTLAGTMPSMDPKPTININQNVTFIWIEMIGNPIIGYPLIRDVDWLPVTESKTSTGGLGFGPSNNPDFYFPSNAFDGDYNTWWVGLTGNGAWDLYYKFDTTQQILGPVEISYFSVNHRPTTTTVEYSDDGVAWTSAGASTGAGATQTVTVAQKTNYMHVKMIGNPIVGYPLIRNITWAVPEGPSGGVNANAFNVPAKAFDADQISQWAGKPNNGIWYLFYGYPAIHTFNTVKVWYLSAAYAPSTQVNVYYSNDGKTWTLHGTMPAPVLDPIPGAASGVSSTYVMGQNAKFICFELIGNPAVTFPLIPYITM